jgi:hypothetical protein
MTRPMVRIHDISTNKIIDREMNDEEFAQWKTDQLANQPVVEELVIEEPAPTE